MQACAAGYALTYASTLKLQLVRWTAVGLTAAKFKPGFSVSNVPLDLCGLCLLLPVSCII
jgi:hypothetical protein